NAYRMEANMENNSKVTSNSTNVIPSWFRIVRFCMLSPRSDKIGIDRYRISWPRGRTVSPRYRQSQTQQNLLRVGCPAHVIRRVHFFQDGNELIGRAVDLLRIQQIFVWGWQGIRHREFSFRSRCYHPLK